MIQHIPSDTNPFSSFVLLALNYDSEPATLKPIYHENDTQMVDLSFARVRTDWVVTSDDLQSKNVSINGKKATFPDKGIPSGLDYAVTSDPADDVKLPGHSYGFFQYNYHQ